jgi:predicted O-methyltransferase YrrM
MNWLAYCKSINDSHTMTTWRGHIQMLAHAAEASKCKTILELGSHAGLSTAALALAVPTARVISVDLCDTVPEQARVDYWASLGITNITPVTDTAANYLSRCKERFDLIFHDAVHGDAAADEYIACAEMTEMLAIHDWEQLGIEYQDDIVNRFDHWEATSDAKGRLLFLGWRK